MKKLIKCSSYYGWMVVIATQCLACYASVEERISLRSEGERRYESGDTYQAKEGTIVNVTFIATDAAPAARLSFEGFDENVTVHRIINGSAKFTLTSLATIYNLELKRERKQITCIVHHISYESGELRVTVNIDVTYKPPAIEKFGIIRNSNGSIGGERIYTAYVNEDVIFTCQFVTGEDLGNPEPKLTLLVLKKGDREYRDVDPRQIRSNIGQGKVILKVRNVDDSGRYLCKAYNSAGTSTAPDDLSLRLEVIGGEYSYHKSGFLKIFLGLFIAALLVGGVALIFLFNNRRKKNKANEDLLVDDSMSIVTGDTSVSDMSDAPSDRKKNKRNNRDRDEIASATTRESEESASSSYSTIG